MFFDPPPFTLDLLPSTFYPRPSTSYPRLTTLDPRPKGKLFLDFCVKVDFCCGVNVTSVTYMYLTGFTCVNIIPEIARKACVQRKT